MAYIGAGVTRFNTADELTVTGDATIDTNTLYVDSTNNRVGIGTSSPATELDVAGNATVGTNTGGILNVKGGSTTSSQVRFFDGGTGRARIGVPTGQTYLSLSGSDTLTADVVIDSSGNVGIGTSSPSVELEIASSAPQMRITDTDTNAVFQINASSTTGGVELQADVTAVGSNPSMAFDVAGSEAMRLDSSGNLLVGRTTSGTLTVAGSEFQAGGAGFHVRDNGTPLYVGRKTSDGNLVEFSKDGTTVGSIGTLSGSLLIGSTDTYLRINDPSDTIFPSDSAGLERDNAINLGKSSSRFVDLYLSGNAYADNFIGTNDTNTFIAMTGGDTIRHFTGGTEAMRIDSSGHLLVGTTDNAVWNDTSGAGGINARSDGILAAARNGGEPLLLNRIGTDGELIKFKKDGADVGSIGTLFGDIYLGTGDTGLKFTDSSNVIVPFNTTTVAERDNAIDLGQSGTRFDDIYATNGTIQTSDQNEKQQIAALTDAEMTAAKAISKLFKTFKWNDSVAEKGDAARTHSGVIAQDVEQAMTDAGLNAGDYAFFISSDWTDEETGEERNRKGIRYPQLMSFIGAATEQRLASIEARLDALEGV
jgi:hypothetical protein